MIRRTHLMLMSREVSQKREAVPERVEQEELELHPEQIPKPPVNPLDD